MDEVPQLLEALPRNKKAIIEVILENRHCLITFPWLKLTLCNPGVMSERRLRSNLKALVDDGVLGKVRSAGGIVFYGFANVANDPDKRNFIRSLRGEKSSKGEHLGSIVLTVRTVRLTPEEIIEWLRKARENPVYRPTGRSARVRRAQMKNYLTMIDWQIDEMKQRIAKRGLEDRRKEIEATYSSSGERNP